MWLTFNTKNNRSIHNNQIPLSHQTTTLSNRKVLISKINFSQFLQHQHQQRHHVAAPPESAGTEIDPRYGAEKRLVPTGPNPLHH
ncbi:clavata3/esr (cle)-related protein 13 [Quercus suber]|uniref:Clavata3/esr (Cle)-related protein 13 n=2 Tax=Quercus suber TaxID=58331 RepID=A0AAW0KN82_QUESU|nr:clavata3/esr (cle)-related protein 13 [Quercus suber]